MVGERRAAVDRVGTRRSNAVDYVTDACWLRATALVAEYRRREFSPIEVTREVLDRIAMVNPRLSANVCVTHEDTTRSAGGRGVALPSPSAQVWDRSGSERTPPAPSGCRPPTVACSASGPPTSESRGAALGRLTAPLPPRAPVSDSRGQRSAPGCAGGGPARRTRRRRCRCWTGSATSSRCMVSGSAFSAGTTTSGCSGTYRRLRACLRRRPRRPADLDPNPGTARVPRCSGCVGRSRRTSPGRSASRRSKRMPAEAVGGYRRGRRPDPAPCHRW